jgi:hypothetical protein
VIFPSADFEETVAVARDYAKASATNPLPVARLTRDFAEAIVAVADACVIGAPCEKHGGAVHGKEAEELRAGVEQILRDTAGAHDDDDVHHVRELRASLIRLLDRVDARDSLAFLEATDPDPDPKEDAASCA